MISQQWKKQPEEEVAKRNVSLVMRALLRDPVTVAALAFLVLVIVLCIGASWFAPYDPGAIDLRARHVPPFGTGKKGTFHLLGTDGLGRDVFSRLLFAGRVSLAVGFAGVLVSGLIGSTIGIVAGYKRGRVEGILMRLVDLQMSIPFLLLALIVLFTIGSGVNNVVIVLALSRWPVYARVSRGLVLEIGHAQFVEYSRIQGASSLRVILNALLPNIISPMAVIATLEVARVILAESTLSFLGMGVQPPQTSWGLMVALGRESLLVGPWNVYVPGTAIFLVSLSVTYLVGFIRSVTDPIQRMKWLYRGAPLASRTA